LGASSPWGIIMNPKLVGAVRELVDAVLVEHCLPVAGNEGLWNEAHTVDCVLAVLREIRAAQELSSLHSWADDRLSAHTDDAYKLDGSEFDIGKGL
jgi:hypothetical protein